MREDGEPALPDSTTTEHNLESAEIAPDTTTPQILEQNSESNIKVDSKNLESTTLPVAEQTLESRDPEPEAIELQDNLTRSAEAKVDTLAESLELPNSGADSTTSSGDQTEGKRDGFKTSESVSGNEGDATNPPEAAGNLSKGEVREAKRTDQIEREQVLNNVKTVRQRQENSEDGHDEL